MATKKQEKKQKKNTRKEKEKEKRGKTDYLTNHNKAT